MKNKIYRSPLFYVGDKFKLIAEIKEFFPKNINKFIEPFVGGGSVFLNTDANQYLINDIDKNIYELHKFLCNQSKNQLKFLAKIENIIDEYKLSKSFREDLVPKSLRDEWKKTYYAKYNKIGFDKLKDDYNLSSKKDTFKLYILLIYGFNRMLRFNLEGKYNLPVGNVDFNKNVINALNDYFHLVSLKKIILNNLDYLKFLNSLIINNDDFVYLDPPYLITFSEYNKLWNEEKEMELLKTLDVLNEKGIRFAISNVTEYKGKTNLIFLEWSKKFNVYPIKSNYISYHDNTIKTFNEVLVTNYGKII
jgi:DNA adenine methylase